MPDRRRNPPRSVPFAKFTVTASSSSGGPQAEGNPSQRFTVNDLLLCDLFQTLREWNIEQSSQHDGWLRIGVPVKLSTGHDDRMSATNGVSFTFLTRNASQCAGDPQTLLAGIHAETEVYTRSRRAMMFLAGLRVMQSIPGAMPLWLGANRCMATAVLSNLGDMSRLFGAKFPCRDGRAVSGDLILEDVFGAPPIRPHTHAAVWCRYVRQTFVGQLSMRSTSPKPQRTPKSCSQGT